MIFRPTSTPTTNDWALWKNLWNPAKKVELLCIRTLWGGRILLTKCVITCKRLQAQLFTQSILSFFISKHRMLFTNTCLLKIKKTFWFTAHFVVLGVHRTNLRYIALGNTQTVIYRTWFSICTPSKTTQNTILFLSIKSWRL